MGRRLHRQFVCPRTCGWFFLENPRWVWPFVGAIRYERRDCWACHDVEYSINQARKG